MKRYIGFFTLALLIGIVASQTFVSGQEKVERRDKKGNSVFVAGKILEESAAGVKIKPAGLGKEEVIPSNEVIRVSYADLPAKAALDLGKAADAETARNYPALLKVYEGIQAMPELKTSAATTQRYINYRVATLRAAVAEGDEPLKAALKGLNDFIAANPDSWQYPHVARQLARLQADTADYTGATKTYEALEKAPTVPSEFKQEATAALLDIAFQSENYDAGQKRIEAVNKDPKAPQALKDRVALYQLGLDAAKGELAAAVKKIEDAISNAKDPSLKALGYNVLGDLYMAKKQRRDAMWSYLHVDVMFNQDRGEHQKAMTRLIKIFKEENDMDKVKQYEEKIARSR